MSITKETIEQVITPLNPKSLVFIETGTWMGDTAQKAIELGFKEIRTVELSNNLFNKAVNRFKNNSNVKLYNGSSDQKIEEMISDVNDQILFWLDAHYSGGDTALGKEISPLYKELDIIAKHQRKDHIILIDDIRDVHNGYMRVTLDGLIQRIKLINSEYKIYFVEGHTTNDILVAKI